MLSAIITRDVYYESKTKNERRKCRTLKKEEIIGGRVIKYVY